MSCTCVKKQVGTGKGNVKGYAVTTLCDECEAKRKADALAQAENQKEMEANILISKRMRDNAKAELISEGKIEEVDGKVKVK